METPYAPPESVIALPVFSTETEQIRQAHLAHETSIKSVSHLFYLGAIISFVGVFASIFSVQKSVDLYQKGLTSLFTPATQAGGALLTLCLMVLFWKLAVGLQQLRPWVRIPTIILSIIGLLGFPVGTLISAYVLYLMLSPKSTMVFSAEYRQIVAETPHLRYRSSVLKTVLLVILVMAAFMGLALYLRTNP